MKKPYHPRIRVLVTSACNAKCYYCHNEGQASAGQSQITPGFVDSLLAHVDCDKVILSGGEPTLRRDIGDICAVVKDHDRYLIMNTNAGNTRNLQSTYGYIDEMRISIDSSNPEEYEAVKGLSFDVVMGNVQEAKKRNIKVQLNFPLRDRLSLERMVMFAGENGVKLNVLEILSSNFGQPKYSLNEAAKYLKRIGFSVYPGTGRFSQMALRDEAKINLKPCFCREVSKAKDINIATWLCQTYTDLYIDSKGEMKPCIYDAEGIPLADVLDDEAGIRQRFKEWEQKFGIGACHSIIKSEHELEEALCTK